jgi:hypothetical protein
MPSQRLIVKKTIHERRLTSSGRRSGAIFPGQGALLPYVFACMVLHFLVSSALAIPPSSSLARIASDPASPTFGEDFTLLLYWDDVPESARLEVIDPSGFTKLDKVFQRPAELTFPSTVYTRYFAGPGSYRVRITPVEGAESGRTFTYSLALKSQPAQSGKDTDRDSERTPLKPPKIRRVRITPSGTLYRGDELQVDVQTDPSQCRVEVEILSPGGTPDPFGYRELGVARDSHTVTKTINFDVSGEYTVRCIARNEAGESPTVEKKLRVEHYPRSERNARLEIKRVLPSKVHAGDEVTVTIDHAELDQPVRFSVGQKDSAVSTALGQTSDSTFTFTAEPRTGFASSGTFDDSMTKRHSPTPLCPTCRFGLLHHRTRR